MCAATTIESLSYPDFVAYIEQENCPPGGKKTVERWCEWANIGSDSYILDLACSTGFSSRNAAALTGCRSIGIDLSELAVVKALKKRPPQLIHQIDFKVGNACELPFEDQVFSHVLAGCNFGFIDDRATALSEVSRVLKKGGILCIATHYFIETPPDVILDKVASKIGFRPLPFWTKEFWNQFFSTELHLKFSADFDLPVVDKQVLEKKIREFCSTSLQYLPQEEIEICFQRLLETRSVINEMREHQKYMISLWIKN